VRGELDLLVPPLRCAVVARDQPHPMETTKVAVDERVARLGLVSRALGEAEMPARVLLPGVRLQERVLLTGARLHVLPPRTEHVLAGVDQPLRVPDRVPVHHIGGHARILADPRPGPSLAHARLLPQSPVTSPTLSSIVTIAIRPSGPRVQELRTGAVSGARSLCECEDLGGSDGEDEHRSGTALVPEGILMDFVVPASIPLPRPRLGETTDEAPREGARGGRWRARGGGAVRRARGRCRGAGGPVDGVPVARDGSSDLVGERGPFGSPLVTAWRVHTVVEKIQARAC